MARISKLEVWAWACICATLIAVRLYPGFVPNLANDAFQYFSVAQNALAGHFGYTSLIHFDAERSFGVMPAPMLTFPLGYPFAIALVSLLEVPLQSAALLVSAMSTVGCVPLLAWLATQLGLSRLFRTVTCVDLDQTEAAEIGYGSDVFVFDRIRNAAASGFYS